MRSRQTVLGSLVLAVAAVSLFAACAESKPASAGASSPVGASQTTASTNLQPVQVPTSGTVAISEEVRRACGISNEDAFFAFDSSMILSVDITPLNAVARCFTVGPLKGRSLRLVGHADPRGSSEYNMALGQGRADSVEGYLGRHGVSRSQLGTSSRGAMDASGANESGWAHDRRVDVMLGS